MVLAMSTRPPVADPAVVDVDDEWGRVPGLRPPIPGWAPLVWFAVLAAVLTAVVVALVLPPGPLDNPDPAYQRDGLLIDGPVLPAGVVGVGFGEQRVVLVFDRMEPDPVELRRWASDVPPGVDVRLVLSETGAPGDAAGRVQTVVDPSGRLADAVDLPTPVDGGPGIGYAVVDSNRRVRYSTLDPDYLNNGFEIRTIVTEAP